ALLAMPPLMPLQTVAMNGAASYKTFLLQRCFRFADLMESIGLPAFIVGPGGNCFLGFNRRLFRSRGRWFGLGFGFLLHGHGWYVVETGNSFQFLPVLKLNYAERHNSDNPTGCKCPAHTGPGKPPAPQWTDFDDGHLLW